MLVVRPSAPRLAKACVAATVLGAVLVPTGAAADDVASGDTVVGELVQAWPEYKSHSEAAAHGDEGPLTWIQTASGDAVRVPTDDLAANLGNPVDGLPVGATVQVVVGGEAADDAAAARTLEPALDVLSADVVTPAADEPPLASAATDVVTVVMMLPAGGVAESGRTLAQVEAAVNGPVAAYWDAQTNGLVHLTTAAGNDPAWVQASVGCSDPAGLWNEAATAAHWTRGAGKHLLVYLPRNSAGCAYGMAEVASLAGGGRLYVTDVATSLIAHELGHNFGLGHSSERQCEFGTETGTCRDVSYRDYYDVMGVSGPWIGSLNAPQAARLGVLPAGQQMAVTSTSASASYTLSPYGGTAGVRAIKVTSPGGVDYWLEYRTATGQDSWLATSANVYGLQQGVLLRRATTGSDTSMLLDGTPSPASDWAGDWSMTLPVGSRVPIADDSFAVTVESVSGASAVVRVSSDPVDLPVPPQAGWDSISATGASLSVAGWALDPNETTSSSVVHVYVDGALHILTADRSRPDVGAAFPGAGDAHGFAWTGMVWPGTHTVCAYAIDADESWRFTSLGCRSITTQLAVPRGALESLSANGASLTVGGWAFDPDDPLTTSAVHVYVDGALHVLSANGSRADVGAANPGSGTEHGFSWTGMVWPGTHTVCAYAIDVDQSWRYTALGCRPVTTQVALPQGGLETVSASDAALTVGGWALDPDDPLTTSAVHVYVDGALRVLSADGSRPDVGASLPGTGTAHGFSWSGTVAPGVHSVCAYAIDLDQSWRFTALGCRSIATQATPPVGGFDVLSANGAWLTAGGWAVDPDSPSSVGQVHVYVDGRLHLLPTDGPRPDVAAAIAGAGDAHGFGWSGTVWPGVHNVCAYAIDVQMPSRFTSLGCRSVTTQLALPRGGFESLTASGGTLTATGWALDPDDPLTTSTVHLYVDGQLRLLSADQSRPDVGTSNPGTGTAHGFTWSGTVGPGAHTACAYAIDLDQSSRFTALGCRSFTV